MRVARFKSALDTNPGVRQQYTQRTAYSSTWKLMRCLLVDASNACSTLNRAASVYIIRGLCPATIVISTYRAPAQLFVGGSREFISVGVLYKAIGNVRVCPQSTATHLSFTGVVIQAKQCWFAVDVTGC